ncbi:hypothetical protein JANAI62_33570 [Jannaschia pagri]|uniref:Transmembrane protein n=1 Tax=Jannaschia pagri TaxID=2829797 RepID=A0ABQ4NR54_9RHOB|nr:MULTISPECIES: DUF6653 family protein [unclassified Jannaschia]GIT92899.1 hypothetical protein JANAI61_33570 [Jannaschia sp. AI_61]GIT96734.1 hypothetical protein JANAI62_33570 [Jannaschia sp. AI_62]
MDIYRAAERLMTMDDRAWLRHANPWSGWTRFTGLPLLVLAIWSRVWVGWWSLLPVALAVAWIWLNPRVFGPPKVFDHWMTRAVLGERIFLTHRDGIAAHHLRAAHVLTWLSLPGLCLMGIGLGLLWWEGAVFGTILTMLPKVWFCDRMVWIHDDWVRAGRAVPGRESA